MSQMQQVFAYLRVSSPGQSSGDGFLRQEAACRDYAAAHDMKIAGIFQEDVSGTEAYRPELAKLMVSLEQNGHGIKIILIERLDRLARDLMISESIIYDMQRQGFKLISTTEGPDLCSNDPSRKLIRQLFGAMAEFDRNMLVLKLAAARNRIKAKTGKCEGRKSYQESEAGRAIVQKIAALRHKPRNAKRLTWAEIAAQLNAEGIKTLDGKAWSPQRCQQTLKRAK